MNNKNFLPRIYDLLAHNKGVVTGPQIKRELGIQKTHFFDLTQKNSHLIEVGMVKGNRRAYEFKVAEPIHRLFDQFQGLDKEVFDLIGALFYLFDLDKSRIESDEILTKPISELPPENNNLVPVKGFNQTYSNERQLCVTNTQAKTDSCGQYKTACVNAHQAEILTKPISEFPSENNNLVQVKDSDQTYCPYETPVEALRRAGLQDFEKIFTTLRAPYLYTLVFNPTTILMFDAVSASFSYGKDKPDGSFLEQTLPTRGRRQYHFASKGGSLPTKL